MQVASGSTSEVFSETVSIMACLILKGAMKAEYGLTAEQCAQYNPKDQRNERLKVGFAMLSRSGATSGGAAAGGEEAPAAVRARFPMDEWLRLSEPLAALCNNAVEMAAYARTLTEKDPWDSTHSRHADNLERLENRAEKKKGRSGRATAGRGRGRGRTEEAEAGGEAEAVAEEGAEAQEPAAAAPSAKQKMAKARAGGRSKAAKKKKLRGDSEESYTD